MSLYLKYRPQDFDNLIGQEHIKVTLINALRLKKISHAYLFCGPRGTGKTTTARLVAKAINCENSNTDGEPCNTCSMCIAANEQSLIDLIEIDAASNRGIDEIRDLRDKIRFAPSTAKNKVYIIDEVHMLTKEAFNALLKTLEEPPANVYFILATTETHKVPATIISRCQRFDFQRISLENLIKRLEHIAEKENLKYEKEALELIAKAVKGGLRDAISILDQLSHHGEITLKIVQDNLGLSDEKAVHEFFQRILNNETEKAINIIDEIYKQGMNLTEFCRSFLEHVREQMIFTVQKKAQYDLAKLIKIIDLFSEARIKIKTSSLEQLPLEVAVIESCNISIPLLNTNNLKTLTQTPKITQKSGEKELTKNEIASDEKKEIKEENLQKSQEGNEAYDFHKILHIWPDILEKIDPPSLRQHLKQATLSQDSPGNITLNFDSAFHFEKFNTAVNNHKLETIIKNSLNMDCIIKCELQNNRKSTTNIGAPSPQIASPREASPIPDETSSQAMDIFGGQW